MKKNSKNLIHTGIKFIILCVFMQFSNIGFVEGQQYDCNCMETDGSYNTFLKNTLISRVYYNTIPHYEGEHYFNSWESGDIFLTSGEEIQNMTLRYDMFMDELLTLRMEDQKIGIVTKPAINGFRLYDRNGNSYALFIRQNIKLPGAPAIDAFLQVLVEGYINMYAFRNLVKAVSASRTTSNLKYFVDVDNQRYLTSRLSKKFLYDIPGIQKEYMKEIISENRLRLRKYESDFIRAVDLYNKAIEVE